MKTFYLILFLKYSITYFFLVNCIDVDINIYVKYLEGYSCILTFLNKNYKCSLGKYGVSFNKKEGDGCTPVGAFPIRQAFYRADKIGIQTNISDYLSPQITKPEYAWCDDPDSEFYNLFVELPFETSHERLWLNDSSVYDLMAVIGYNDCPVIPGLGSAIFLHLTESYGPTAGCVAVALEDLKFILNNILPESMIFIS